MLRGYLIYFVMFIALGLGLWGVLRVGATLQAPAEIAGEWRVRWETTSPTGSGYHGTMKIEQSGRYCTFRFDGTRTMSLKMVGGTALGQTDAQQPVARLVGGDYQMTLQRTANRDELRLEISGRDHFRGFADRVNRPGDSAASPSSTLPPVADARR
ncbi:MAG: hypothetical protein WBD40_02235 [Tepidisphaeraceae bacterium]